MSQEAAVARQNQGFASCQLLRSRKSQVAEAEPRKAIPASGRFRKNADQGGNGALNPRVLPDAHRGISPVGQGRTAGVRPPPKGYQGRTHPGRKPFILPAGNEHSRILGSTFPAAPQEMMRDRTDMVAINAFARAGVQATTTTLLAPPNSLGTIWVLFGSGNQEPSTMKRY